ncbi:MAG: FGGY family carbohydrate kinase [Pseudomonadota bacterium]
MTKLWLGLDVGTTAVKAAVYTPDGDMVCNAERPTRVLRVLDGGAEQDMNAVWDSVCACLSEIAAGCDATQIASLGVCAQGDGMWPLDTDLEPVRPAILWSDTRSGATRDLEELTREGRTAAIGRGCHTSLWPGTSGMAWRWMRDAEPPNAARTAHVVTCGDWIGAKLTGEVATDFSNATIPFLEIAARNYGTAQIDALECGDLRSRMPAPRSAKELLGHLTAKAAGATGLPEGLPVSVPTLDLGAMIVGMGMARAGETMMILGTTAVANILMDRVTPTDAPIGASVLHPTAETIIRVLAPSTGAAAFDWFASLHPQSLAGDSSADIAAKLNALITDVPVGSNGVTFLPYLTGERAPFVSPGLRASFHGMSPTTTQGELGRAVMEGTALSLRHCFESENGLPSEAVRLTGGGARNAQWCQIIADIIGQDILVGEATDQGLWGAACIGAAATGAGDPVNLARREDRETRYAKNAEAHATYGHVYARYEFLSRSYQGIQGDLNEMEMKR